MQWRKETTRDFTVLQWAIDPDGVEIIVAKKWKDGKRNWPALAKKNKQRGGLSQPARVPQRGPISWMKSAANNPARMAILNPEIAMIWAVPVRWQARMRPGGMS
jgi:hypothetical protein